MNFVRRLKNQCILPGGGILVEFDIILVDEEVLLFISIGFAVDVDDNGLLGGVGAGARGSDETTTDGTDGGSGAGDLGAGPFIFSVNCTGNIRVAGIGVNRVVDSVVTGIVFVGIVVIFVVVVVDVGAFVHDVGI